MEREGDGEEWGEGLVRGGEGMGWEEERVVEWRVWVGERRGEEAFTRSKSR